MDMEYVVGSVADFISGNLTPSRPANLMRARTPVKHQPSPHVTPRSETPLGGREAILSPSVLRKKAVAKKSPKRIFEKEDLDKTAEGVVSSPKADKAKKHLQAALEETEEKIKNPKRKLETEVNGEPVVEESISKKKKNKKNKQNIEDSNEKEETIQEAAKQNISKRATGKKRRQRKKKAKKNLLKENTKTNTVDKVTQENTNTDTVVEENNNASVKKNKKNKKAKKNQTEGANTESKEPSVKTEHKNGVPVESNLSKREKGKNRKNKNKNKQAKSQISESLDDNVASGENSDSEHDSDDEIESETEQDVKQILDSGPIEDEDSNDEEEESKKSKKNKPDEKKEKQDTSKADPFLTAEETKRTLFVGNVPMSKRCKKEIKQIFNKYGTIESVRIRTVPVKDMRTNPKVAVITNQIHPDRTSVNVYVKFSNESSMTEALAENNRVLGEHHLRVTRADSTSVLHDPRKTIFIGNIPFGIEDETLRAKFEKCGEIESVRIVRDRALQIGKGFGYVNFASTDGVELALSLTEDDLAIKNRILRVRRYTQAPPGQKVKGKGPNQLNRGPQGNRGFQGNREHGSRSFQGNRDQGNRGFQGNKDQGNRDYQGNRGFQGNRDQGNTIHQSNKGFQGNRNDWNKDKFNSKPRDESGALRRLNKKRDFQDNSAPNTGPPQKKQKMLDQPKKEKKQKKEFVGMTAEKKKKKKLDKGAKRKQKLSEILTRR